MPRQVGRSLLTEHFKRFCKENNLRGVVAYQRDGKIIYEKIVFEQLWCVCWYGETEEVGWQQHKGPPVLQEEALKRLQHGMTNHPHVFFWLEKSR